MIRIYITGPHSNRSPLSYSALASLFAGTVQVVDTPAMADLFLFAHTLDVENLPMAVCEQWRLRPRPIVVLSEEPFWDTIWGKRPLERHLIIDTRFGAVPVVQLNHHTSKIFAFHHIPYYLLTDHRFASAYAYHFRRNAARRAADWKADFERRAVDVTFMAERRPEKYHNVRFPDGDIIGLCAWRTELALGCRAAKVERLGQSWQGGATRFTLRDWHLDKLVRLNGRSRILSGLENTHQPDYISEKIFDAFALGARPLYFASPGHRVHDFNLPPAAWLNLYDLPVPAAVEAIAAAPWDAAFYAAYTEAQQQLEALFADPALFVAERERLQKSVLEALTEVLNGA